MQQADVKALAHQFMCNAVQIQSGQNIWVEYLGPDAQVLAEACADVVRSVGATPLMVDSGSAVINREIGGLSPEQIEAHGLEQLRLMRGMQGYIRIKDDANEARISLPHDILQHYKQAMRAMFNYRVNNLPWLLVAAPTEAFAADCGMTLPAFESFYQNVCLADYGKMTEAVKPLEGLLRDGKEVHILGEETDIGFSIEGIPAVSCTGKRNIPDGECFTAPIKESVEGRIKFGPSRYVGESFKFIKAKFEQGRIVEAEAENKERTERLNQILDIDEGARYVGEFAISFNPYILHPMGTILFDEKIAGAFHMATGNCFDSAYNGVKSANHWDKVNIQRQDYGGGQIWIDGRLIRQDGIFVVPELAPLNPQNLIKSAAQPRPQPV